MQRSSFALNDKEKKVLGAFSRAGVEMTIEEIARKAFDTKRYGSSPKTRGNSWVRNSVRKLLRLNLVTGGGKSGKYTRTEMKPESVLKNAEEDGKFSKSAKTKTETKAKAKGKTETKAKAKAKTETKAKAKAKAKNPKTAEVEVEVEVEVEEKTSKEIEAA
jgi:hypothetical protein